MEPAASSSTPQAEEGKREEGVSKPTTADTERFIASTTTSALSKLAPFNPSHASAQEIAFERLALRDGDVLYDLGCGDGRFLALAAKRCLELNANVKFFGVEYDRVFFDRAREATRGLEEVKILYANVMDTDFADATAVYLYLVPEGLRELEASLHEILRKGGRIAAYTFSVPNLTPLETHSSKGGLKVYIYDKSSLP